MTSTEDKYPAIPLSAAYLNDLLNNTLDPGYQAAVDRPKRGWEQLLVALACLAIGLTLTVAYQQTHRSAPAREQVRQRLIDRIRVMQTTGNRLNTTAQTLAAQVSALRAASLPGAAGRTQLGLDVQSGATAVAGDGVVVRLTDPPQTSPTPSPTVRAGVEAPAPQRLTDVDVRSVVNELWAAGAEAIAVNGVRLTATSAIRFAGQTVLVDFRPVDSPYSVEAIGDSDRLLTAFADSATARSLKTREAVQGITLRFDRTDGLRLDAATVTQPRYAHLGAPAK